MSEDALISEILRQGRNIAVIGLSSRPTRASYGVSEYMQSVGYRIIPVNPGPGGFYDDLGQPAGGDLFREGGHDVLVQGLAERARLLRPVEDRDRAHARGERGDERVGGEGPEQADTQDADLLTACCERAHRVAHGAVARAHEHDHPLGVR